MKKSLLLLTLLLVTNAFAQFPGYHANLLMGKELKVKELPATSQKYGYHDFYSKEQMTHKDVYAKSGTSTPYEKLAGKVFKVLSVEPFKNGINLQKFRLKIENKDTGIIFYEYSPEYPTSFIFEVVGGLQLPEGFYCESLTIKNDKFTGEITSTSPYSDGIALIKVEKEGKKTIYLAINQIGPTLSVGAKGLILLLENGKRIDKPDAQIDVKAQDTGKQYIYSAFVRLEESEIKLLSENNITDNRLYIYDGVVENGERIKEFIKCMIK